MSITLVALIVVPCVIFLPGKNNEDEGITDDSFSKCFDDQLNTLVGKNLNRR